MIILARVYRRRAPVVSSRCVGSTNNTEKATNGEHVISRGAFVEDPTGENCAQRIVVGRAGELPGWLIDGMFRLRHRVFYQNVGQCSGVYAGGEGPRGSAR
ncbi:hypothetical protein ACQEVF_01465 [Nonomuraea polychroma]|uniref:hypothetical protein n=1 Tax=Nonomuraea polychroma TaxID=46176 RepID=UPI003D8B3162